MFSAAERGAPVADWKGQPRSTAVAAAAAAAAAADTLAANVAEDLEDVATDAAANVAAVARLPQAQVMTARDGRTVAPMIYFELLAALPFRVVLTSTRSLLQPMQLVPATGQRRGRSEGEESNALRTSRALSQLYILRWLVLTCCWI